MYDVLKFNADLHTRTGRYSKLNLACPRFNRETEGGRTFSVSATRLWNQLLTNLKCVAGLLRGRVIKRYKLVLVYPIGHVWCRVILDGGGRERVSGDKKNMNFFLKSSAKLSKLLRPWRFSIKSFFTREVRRDTFVTIKTTGEVI